MLRSLTAKQFAEWEHYARLEPFNELRQDYRVASIVQMVANVNRGKNQAAYSLQDFMLKFNEEPEAPKRQTWQQQLSIATAIATAFNSPGAEI